MIRKNVLLVVCCSGLIGLGLVGLAQQPAQKPATPTATEAPAGFKTPTLSKHPGSKSVSNGIPELPNDTFALDQANFESREGNDSGLGPVHNATICADCHQGTGTGGPSQVTEVRAGHLDANGNFVNPTIFINQAEEHLPATENIRTLRAALNTLGDGFVEAIDDQTLIDIAAEQPKQSNGMI